MRQKTVRLCLLLAVLLAFAGCEELAELQSEYSGAIGQIEGIVRDATTGDLLEGASISIEGFEEYANLIATSDELGEFIVNAPTGAQTLLIELTGYTFPPVAVEVEENETTVVPEGDTTGSPALSTGTLRIVLSWGQTPYDLDSYLLTPNGQTVYYRNKTPTGAGANLDLDDRVSYGPETITITDPQSGTYVYYVDNYSSSPEITTSNAIVQVYDSSGLAETFNVPTTGTGDYWHVFNMESDGTGNFTISTVNQISSLPPSN